MDFSGFSMNHITSQECPGRRSHQSDEPAKPESTDLKIWGCHEVWLDVESQSLRGRKGPLGCFYRKLGGVIAIFCSEVPTYGTKTSLGASVGNNQKQLVVVAEASSSCGPWECRTNKVARDPADIQR